MTQVLLDLLEVLLLLTAFSITTAPSVKRMILTYRIQSTLLALVVGLTALTKSEQLKGNSDATTVLILILLIILLPIILAWVIKPLLVRATLSKERLTIVLFAPTLQRIIRPFVTRSVKTSVDRSMLRYNEMERSAEREWLQQKPPGKRQYAFVLFLILVFIAFLIASAFKPDVRIGLLVSLTLHLIGLYNMFAKRDIISQVIGLLIMDHGLYLAVVRIVEIPVPAALFVVSLYFYTVITMFILVILLPRLRQVTESIDLFEISEKSNLRG